MSAIISTSSSAASCWAFMGSMSALHRCSLPPSATHSVRPAEPAQRTVDETSTAAAAAASVTFSNVNTCVLFPPRLPLSIKLDSDGGEEEALPLVEWEHNRAFARGNNTYMKRQTVFIMAIIVVFTQIQTQNKVYVTYRAVMTLRCLWSLTVWPFIFHSKCKMITLTNMKTTLRTFLRLV